MTFKKIQSLSLSIAVTLSLIMFPFTSAGAATTSKKPIKAILSTPITIGHLTSGVGDQISSAVLTPTGLVMVGTVESSLSEGWVTSQTLGGTDGFIEIGRAHV